MYKKKGIISEGGEVLALWLEGSLMKMSCNNRLHSNFMKVNLKYNFVWFERQMKAISVILS